LEELKSEFLLDLYLAEHVEHVYICIREKLFIQFLQPYRLVNLDSMANSLLMDPASLEQEIVKLIESRKVKMRIDQENRLLRAQEEDPQMELYKEVIANAAEYNGEARIAMMNAIIATEGLEVKSPQRRGHV
jgi:COP9 signalosome complex subunit 1